MPIESSQKRVQVDRIGIPHAHDHATFDVQRSE